VRHEAAGECAAGGELGKKLPTIGRVRHAKAPSTRS
jgi:hypothetical protein